MALICAIGAAELRILQGDITRARVDAIVNAANSRLAGGGGVDGAIQRAAGPELLRDGLAIVAERGPLPPGEAVLTPGYALAAPYVIHTVGPIWRGGSHGEAETLARAYRSCLALAAEYGLRSVAFPAISCGAYGYPLESAASIALAELRDGLSAGLAASAHLYLFSEPTRRVFADAAAKLLRDCREDSGAAPHEEP